LGFSVSPDYDPITAPSYAKVRLIRQLANEVWLTGLPNLGSHKTPYRLRPSLKTGLLYVKKSVNALFALL